MYDKLKSRILKQRITELIKDNKYVSKNKAHSKFDELYGYALEKETILTEDEIAELERDIYTKLENEFISELSSLATSINPKDEKEMNKFLDRANKIFGKYCIDQDVLETISDKTISEEENKSLVKKAEEQQNKKSDFSIKISILAQKYLSENEFIQDKIDEIILQSDKEDLKEFVRSVGKAYGLIDSEIKDLLNHIEDPNGRDRNPLVCRKNNQLFTLYEMSKSNSYPKPLNPDDYGIIDLDDYAFIISHRGLDGINKGNNWIISANKDVYLSVGTENPRTSCDFLKAMLNKVEKREKKENDIISQNIKTQMSYDELLRMIDETSQKINSLNLGEDFYKIDEEQKNAHREQLETDINSVINSIKEIRNLLSETEFENMLKFGDEKVDEILELVNKFSMRISDKRFYNFEKELSEIKRKMLEVLALDKEIMDNSSEVSDTGVKIDKFRAIKKISKKIADLTKITTTSALLTQKVESPSQFNQVFEGIQEVVDNPENMTFNQKIDVLKEVDDITPTTTSEATIRELIKRINDPKDNITPKEIFEELLTEQDENLQEEVTDNNEKIDELINTLGIEISKLYGVDTSKESIELIQSALKETIKTDHRDIGEKNNFVMPQLAKQLGIDTATFYKSMDAREKVKVESLTDNIVEILRRDHLVDDTKYFLVKNFLNSGERYISADTFLPSSRKGSKTVDMSTILQSSEKYVKSHYEENGFSLKEAQDALEGIRRGIIKQSLFDKLTLNKNSSNKNWGLVLSSDNSLKLAPLHYFKSYANSGEMKKARTVRKNREDISDFILEYCDEEWFRDWLKNSVGTLSLDQAIANTYMSTRVELNSAEKDYYSLMLYGESEGQVTDINELKKYRQSFNKNSIQPIIGTREIVDEAIRFNFDKAQIRESAQKRRSFGEEIKYKIQGVTGNVRLTGDKAKNTVKNIIPSNRHNPYDDGPSM